MEPTREELDRWEEWCLEGALLSCQQVLRIIRALKARIPNTFPTPIIPQEYKERPIQIDITPKITWDGPLIRDDPPMSC